MRHKVVEVRLRADEELEVRRADGAVLVGVELRQRPRREGRGDRRAPARVGRQVRLRRRQVGDVEGAVAVDVAERATRRRAAGGARRRRREREQAPPRAALRAAAPRPRRAASCGARRAATVVEDEAAGRRRARQRAQVAVGADNLAVGREEVLAASRRRRRRPPCRRAVPSAPPSPAGLAGWPTIVTTKSYSSVAPSGSVKVPARLSPALSTHAPAGAPPKSVGFELVGVSASRW